MKNGNVLFDASQAVLHGSLDCEKAWIMLEIADKSGNSVSCMNMTKRAVIAELVVYVEKRMEEQGLDYDLCSGGFQDRMAARNVIAECGGQNG